MIAIGNGDGFSQIWYAHSVHADASLMPGATIAELKHEFTVRVDGFRVDRCMGDADTTESRRRMIKTFPRRP